MEIPATRNRRNFVQIASILQFGRIGRRQFMEVARLAVALDPKLAPIVADWDRMKPPLQNAVDLDALCEAHEVDPAHFIGVVGEAAMKYGNNSAILIAALQMPEVVMPSAKTALKPGGDPDENRKMLFQHAGFLPVPKGKQLRMLNHAIIGAEANTNIGKPLPIFEQTITALDKRRQHEE